jgi:hypothetical protein
MTATILDMAKYPSLMPNWDNINKHKNQFNTEYNYDDCRILLQLALMVTATNYLNVPLNPPNWLEDTKLVYYNCPIFNGSATNAIKNNNKTNPTILGHVLYDYQNNTLIIIFTSTVNICMAYMDLRHTQVDINNISNYTQGMKAHYGIYTAYMSVRDQLIQTIQTYLPRNPQIIITGHSLGGGISQICALDLVYYNPIHYSFAAPLIFNESSYLMFNRNIKHSYRIANSSDIITFSPFPVMPNGDAFFHVGTSVCFQRNLGTLPLNHSIAYAQEYNLQYDLISIPITKQALAL